MLVVAEAVVVVVVVVSVMVTVLVAVLVAVAVLVTVLVAVLEEQESHIRQRNTASTQGVVKSGSVAIVISLSDPHATIMPLFTDVVKVHHNLSADYSTTEGTDSSKGCDAFGASVNHIGNVAGKCMHEDQNGSLHPALPDSVDSNCPGTSLGPPSPEEETIGVGYLIKFACGAPQGTTLAPLGARPKYTCLGGCRRAIDDGQPQNPSKSKYSTKDRRGCCGCRSDCCGLADSRAELQLPQLRTCQLRSAQSSSIILKRKPSIRLQEASEFWPWAELRCQASGLC